MDDDFYSSYVVSATIQQYSLECDLVYDGQQAFEMVMKKFERTQTSYRLILMDECMPLCDGVETTKMIRDYLSTRLADSEQPFIVCMVERQ